MTLTLHSYWRATAPYRVRIGLQLKGLDYSYVGVNLLTGEQHAADYVATTNAQHLTPALEADGRVLTQSLAILEWLEEVHPEPALLPKDAFDRADRGERRQIHIVAPSRIDLRDQAAVGDGGLIA
ncbi:MAG: hypothetical protein EON94_03630, partial [Caulobacteraceae bacterium]